MSTFINTLKNKISFFTMALLLSITLVQCSKDEEPEVINEEEEITTVELIVQKQGGTATTLTYEDGGSIPTITLDANSTYNVSISFLNKSNPDDIENVTEEVVEEVDEHQIFYQIQGSNVTIASASDDISDSSGNPLMLSTDWTTGAANTGTVQVYLIHEPVTKTGSTRNDFVGSTDIQVPYPVIIQ